MKPSSFLAFLTALALASNAHALKVTNLDSVPHTVLYEAGGVVTAKDVAPDQVINFHGYPDGLLSLQTKTKPARAKQGMVHADGILSGIIGASRGEDIPAASNYDFVIWPGGQLNIQHHRQQNVY